MSSNETKQPAEQANDEGSPINGVVPPVETRWKPGQSGNPAGRPAAGATIKEHINRLSAEDATEADLRKIARDKSAPWSLRTAAERMIRTIEAPDLADFEPYLKDGATLVDLREKGINTEAVKKAKVKTRQVKNASGDYETETECEIELYDRSGDDFDRLMDRTDGKSKQTVDVTSNGETVKQFVNVNVDAV